MTDSEVVLPMFTTVVKKPHDVYMGRKFRKFKGGYWGNPFKDEDWAANYETLFKLRLRHDPEFALRTLGLRGLHCACFCQPNPCHVDIVARWVNEQPLEDCMAAFAELERLGLDRRSSEGQALMPWFNQTVPELDKHYGYKLASMPPALG